ncbi:MAG: type II toxin-antitoxin system VapC family toxin [Actinobacteria bacterium]|nr:type II toxin-antitoxin system VapC family toxin [Actinomycetota bacterium]
MGAVLLDTHVVHWWSAEPERVSAPARGVLEGADELVVAAISWYELAWLAEHERIAVRIPVASWLKGLAAQLRTIPITPAIAHTAVSLPSSFPGDPADRMIYGTAVENDLQLVSKDKALRAHPHPRPIVVW